MWMTDRFVYGWANEILKCWCVFIDACWWGQTLGETVDCRGDEKGCKQLVTVWGCRGKAWFCVTQCCRGFFLLAILWSTYCLDIKWNKIRNVQSVCAFLYVSFVLFLSWLSQHNLSPQIHVYHVRIFNLWNVTVAEEKLWNVINTCICEMWIT